MSEKPHTFLLQKDEYEATAGLSVFMAAMFVSGELAGTGVLALPQAVGQSGWIGIPLIIMCGLVSGYNGMNLGKCWTMLLEKYPEIGSGQERRPYPLMGEKAFGNWMRIIIMVAIEVNLFGSSSVFMLLASENVQSILQEHAGVDISFCYWLLVVTAILLPLSWLGTPKDFWPVAITATVSTTLAVVVIVIGMALDIHNQNDVPHATPTVSSFMLSIGTFIFSFGGTGTFPTVQQDMKETRKFPISVVSSYFYVLVIYLSVTIIAYFSYGSSVNGNLLKSLPSGPLRVAAEIFILVHVLGAFVINLNPMLQDVEEFLDIPHEFNWKRCLSRTIIVLLALFVALTVPRFDAILSLIGASSGALLTFIGPALLYLRFLETRTEKGNIPLYVKVLNYEIIAVGIFGAVAGSVVAIIDISHTNFVPPCYVNLTAANQANQV